MPWWSHSPLLQRSWYHHLRATVSQLQIQGGHPDGSRRELSRLYALWLLKLWHSRQTDLVLKQHPLQGFANATLRTLCLCYKDISATEYEAWSRKHREAQLVTSNRDAALDRVYEEIEKNLMASGGLELSCGFFGDSNSAKNKYGYKNPSLFS